MNNRDKNNNILEKDYFNDLNKIKETIWQNQNKASIHKRFPVDYKVKKSHI